MKRFAYLFILTLGCVSILQPQTVAALPAWDPGRIIDDAVFTNVNTMTPSNIQNFLNSKIPSCDTNGTQLSEYGGPDINNDGKVQRWEYGQAYLSQTTFTCLKDYVAPDNRSAAQVIYDTALRYSINPQVFIVLLQKEQGLVTDNWPSNSQYRTATGYGCPDTAPCDSQYYGIINQLDWAGKMFRAIVNNSPTWYTPYILGNNTIRYSPSVSCGSSAVTIQNRSTQALYNYTPYQPNSAALSAGYGNAPPCGSYGNRNFWLYFNNWFGNTNYILGNIPAQLTTYSRLACTIPNFSPNVVGRLYQPDTQDYLFTTNHSEACSAIAVGYVWDGIVFNNVDGQPSTTPVYRVRRGVSHVYTANPSLYTTMISDGYINEGIIFYGYTNSDTNRLPVYMLGQYDNRTMTSAGGEGVYFVNDLGYQSNGIGFYTAPIATGGTSLQRLRKGSDRLYTVSSEELSLAITRYAYIQETTGLQVESYPGQQSLPVYRLNSQHGRLYTTNRIERDLAIINHGYNSEGIGFYSYQSTTPNALPTYRSTNYGAKARLYTQHLGEHNNSQTYYGYIVEGVSWYGL